MKVKSLLYDRAAGSIGRVTASRGQGGNVLRTRKSPKQPNSERQLVQKRRQAEAFTIWSSAEPEQRANWDRFAWTIIGRVGSKRVLKFRGWNAFLRAYIISANAKQRTDRLIGQPHRARGFVAPVQFELGRFETQDGIWIGTLRNISTSNYNILVYDGEETNQTINNYKSIYKPPVYLNFDEGTLHTLFIINKDKRHWLKVQRYSPTGRSPDAAVRYIDAGISKP